MTPQSTIVTLPKFKASTKLDLNSTLQALGVTAAFDINQVKDGKGGET